MKNRSRIIVFLTAAILVLTISACGRERTGCLDGSATPRPTLQLADLLMTPAPPSPDGPSMVEIKNKMIEVDKLVDYPLCNDDWSGTVYVSCDSQVAIAEFDEEENPLFFAGCSLNIEPNTIVYVEAHNDTAYYKGCSCHTGGDPVH